MTITANVGNSSLYNNLEELKRAIYASGNKDVGGFSEGSVVRQAEVLFTFVPIDAKGGALEVEAAIAAKDIGHVRPGAKARIKLTAYPFQKHGFLEGEIRMVSPDAFVRDAAG